MLYIQLIDGVCIMETTPSVMNLRLPADLKKAFEEVCRQNDQTASQVLRAMIRRYIKENAQGDLLGGRK